MSDVLTQAAAGNDRAFGRITSHFALLRAAHIAPGMRELDIAASHRDFNNRRSLLRSP